MTIIFPPTWHLEDCRQYLLRLNLCWTQFLWTQRFPAPYSLHWEAEPVGELTYHSPRWWELKSKWKPPVKGSYNPNPE